jgi:hypothetical protein
MNPQQLSFLLIVATVLQVSRGSISLVNLGLADDFSILTKAGISNVPKSYILGNIGSSPIALSAITGFSLIADATNVFSRSSQVVGLVYAANCAPPTPARMTTAILDMQAAFTDAAGRAPDVTELGTGNIGGMTLVAGVYKWSSGLLIPTDLTLSGSATDIWIFQIAQTLTVGSGVKIILAGGALPSRIFWQVSGAVTLGTTSQFEGVILGQTNIVVQTGASVIGKLLAQTAVTLDHATVINSDVITSPPNGTAYPTSCQPGFGLSKYLPPVTVCLNCSAILNGATFVSTTAACQCFYANQSLIGRACVSPAHLHQSSAHSVVSQAASTSKAGSQPVTGLAASIAPTAAIFGIVLGLLARLL